MIGSKMSRTLYRGPIGGRMVMGGATSPMYTFDGVSGYATIPSYTSKGAPSVYRQINYQTTNDDGYIINTTEPITEFGRVSGNYHSGDLSNVEILDGSPMHNTKVVFGNSARYATLTTRIVLSGDFIIEFDWIRADQTGTTGQPILSDNTTSKESVQMMDSGGANLNAISLQSSSGGYFFAGATTGIAQGQSAHIKIERVGGYATAYVDGVSKGTSGLLSNAVNIDTLLALGARSGRYFKSGCAIQNLQISDGTNVYAYLLTEGASATQIVNTGNTGTGYNGAWTAATWTAIENNDRFYAMREGTGSTLNESETGKDATLQNYSAGNWTTRSNSKPIWNKSPSLPLLVVLTGQSNAIGSIATSPYTQNPAVWDLATNGGSTPQVLANLAWTLPVQDTGSVKTDVDANAPYVGYTNARRATVGLSCANALQIETGRDVYVVQAYRAGWGISHWASPSGEMYTSLNDAVAAALATPELAGVSYPDIVIWDQGETDASSAMAVATYSTNWRAWRTAVEALWSRAGRTAYYLVPLTYAYNLGGTPTYGAPLNWAGLEQVVTDSDSFVKLANDHGTIARVGNEIHYTGDSLNRIGARIARDALYG